MMFDYSLCSATMLGYSGKIPCGQFHGVCLGNAIFKVRKCDKQVVHAL